MKVCVLTGAGMSAESGIATFRGQNGLWEEHDIMEVASINGWRKNPHLVLQFYNERRKKLPEVQPNKGHLDLVRLEEHFDTFIITQNIDDLHERAGSSKIIHLHGELNKVRSFDFPDLIYQWQGDLKWGDRCEKGSQLRPHIVWFGEAVPMLEDAVIEVSTADFIIIIGTSMQVYPAASLTAYAPPESEIIYIDPNPQINYELTRAKHLKIFRGKATEKVPEAVDYLISKTVTF